MRGIGSEPGLEQGSSRAERRKVVTSVGEIGQDVLYSLVHVPFLEESMRTLLLLPITAAVVVTVGCVSQGREPAAVSQPKRDLTLPAQVTEVAVASPVELQQVRTPHRALRPSLRVTRSATARHPKPEAPKVMTAVLASSPTVLPVPQPVSAPASTEAEPANDRELLPGKTVTVIPASSGPSSAPEPAAGEFPTRRGWGMGGGSGMGGGGCRGRGPGIGIAGAPSPAFR